MAMPFLRAVITDVGISLLNRVQNGEGTIVFTRMSIGNGVYSTGEKKAEILRRVEGLRSLKNSYELSGVVKLDNNSVKTAALISNQDPVTKKAVITEGYNINEIGLFAKVTGDEKDILLSIAVTEGEQGDYIPAFTGRETAQITQNFIVSISNGVNINLKYSGGAVALREDLERHADNMDIHVSKELKEKIDKALLNIEVIMERLARLESDVRGDFKNPDTILGFGELSEINLIRGIHNEAEKRIEC